MASSGTFSLRGCIGNQGNLSLTFYIWAWSIYNWHEKRTPYFIYINERWKRRWYLTSYANLKPSVIPYQFLDDHETEMLKRNARYEKNKVFQKKSRINGQEYILSLDLCMLSYFPWGFLFSSHFFGEGRSGGVIILLGSLIIKMLIYMSILSNNHRRIKLIKMNTV